MLWQVQQLWRLCEDLQVLSDNSSTRIPNFPTEFWPAFKKKKKKAGLNFERNAMKQFHVYRSKQSPNSEPETQKHVYTLWLSHRYMCIYNMGVKATVWVRGVGRWIITKSLISGKWLWEGSPECKACQAAYMKSIEHTGQRSRCHVTQKMNWGSIHSLEETQLSK